jgi:hypothetical protein
MTLKPETALRKRLENVDRHLAMLKALRRFIKKHRKLVTRYSIHPLNWQGTIGLKFSDYALIVPHYTGGQAVLTLVKSGEAWDGYEGERTVEDDVSEMSTKQVTKLLDDMHPDAHEDDAE